MFNFLHMYVSVLKYFILIDQGDKVMFIFYFYCNRYHIILSSWFNQKNMRMMT